jgi:hypothetical protein
MGCLVVDFPTSLPCAEMCIGLRDKWLSLLSNFNQNWNMMTVLVKLPDVKFHENTSNG